MCGIAGIFAPDGLAEDALLTALRAMGQRLRHRGPDAGGEWHDAPCGIGFAHRRLSIQDLSEAGAQPMRSASGRHVICYNGEVFSAPEIRAELIAAGHKFRGHSDTETILEAMEAWGLDRTLSRMVGQFAFALWDAERRRLTLVRDRLGIKPLHWTAIGGQITFASELGALLSAVPAPPGICRQGLASYLAFNAVPAPLTIYNGIHKLAPGRALEIAADGTRSERAFWSLEDALDEAETRGRVSDPATARELIEETLAEAVRCRLLADVPLGAFLSGGIDSSLITALMQETSAAPITSYSIGSASAEYDEARHARAIADRLGTRHEEFEVDDDVARAAVPGLMRHYGEPFGDSSAIPTLLLCQLARRDVTVALSGDGGDEVFAGYNRHRWHDRVARLGAVPRRLAGAAARGVGALPPAAVDRLARFVGQGPVARRLAKLSGLLAAGDDTAAAHLAALNGWPELLPGLSADPPEAYARMGDHPGLAPHERLQAIDLLTYLPDDILTKVDRASMAHALEVRVPFLDHRVVVAGFRLAPACKLAGGETKAVLRRMLETRLPRALIERPKQGFAMPVGDWLRGPLKAWAAELIGDTAWGPDLGIERAPIERAWAAHLAGREDRSDRLWSVLMLAQWWQGHGAGDCRAEGETAEQTAGGGDTARAPAAST